jgi:hypothetical protein
LPIHPADYDGVRDRRHEERKVDHEQKPRERSFIRKLVPNWRPTRAQALRGTELH